MEVKRDERGRILPGYTGNPNGRPKNTITLVGELLKYLEDNPAERERLIMSLVKEAKSGNTGALRDIFDRVDGKVAEKIEGSLNLLITPDMRALAAREMIDVKAEETKLLEDNDGQDSKGTDAEIQGEEA